MTKRQRKSSDVAVQPASHSFEWSGFSGFSGGRYQIIEVVGMHMEPAFYRFDHVVIDLDDKEISTNGGIFAYRNRRWGDGISIAYISPLQDDDLSWKSQRIRCSPGNDAWLTHEMTLPEIEVVGRIVGRITKRFDQIQRLELEVLRLKQGEDNAQKSGGGRWYKHKKPPSAPSLVEVAS
jgi:hypothetical protein